MSRPVTEHNRRGKARHDGYVDRPPKMNRALRKRMRRAARDWWRPIAPLMRLANPDNTDLTDVDAVRRMIDARLRLAVVYGVHLVGRQ